MDYLGTAADIIGILGAVFALAAWLKARQVQQDLQREQQRQLRTVTIVLQHGADRLELPVYLRRAEFTRAETLGRDRYAPDEGSWHTISPGLPQ